MAAPEMRYPRRVDGDQLPPMARRRGGVPGGGLQQFLLDSGRALMLLGALVLASQLTRYNAEHVFVAFILWLLGAALVMLSLVGAQFPRLAVAAAFLARALRNYLLGGLRL